MARRRASMREGPLAELFKATEAAQRQGDNPDADAPVPRVEEMPTVEYRLAELDDDQPVAEVEPGPGLGGPGSDADVVDITVVRSASEAGEVDPPTAGTTTPAADNGATAVGEPPVARWAEPAPRMRLSPRGESASYLAVIRVVGVGGGGLNAVNRMIEAGISQVEFVGLNTDIQQLRTCEAPIKLHIGRELDPGTRLGRRRRDRASRGRGGLRPDQARAPRIRPRVRHGRRGRRHRLGRRSCGRADRPRARSARGRDRDGAIPLRGHAPPPAGRSRGRRSCAACVTP